MRSPMPSRAAISTISARNSAISCCRWCITPAWRRSRTHSRSATWSKPITRKMIRRHPHVFADNDGRLAPSDVKRRLGAHQGRGESRTRCAAAAGATRTQSLLSSVKAGQPALTRAMELQRKASTVGFDWNDPRAVLHKIREEADEIEAALDRGDARRARRRDRRSAVRAGQSGAACRRRPGNGAARHQRQIRAPLRLYRARAGGQGTFARGRLAGRDGRAVE